MINQRENYRTLEQDDSHVEMPPAVGIVSESLVQIVWRSRWIVLLATVVSLAAAFAYLVKATPIFTSTSRVYVEQRGPKIVTNYEGVLTQSKNYIYTQAELLKSTPILQSALEKPGIKRMKIFEKVDNHIIYLKKKGLDVEVGKKDDIISISSDSPQPAEAAKLVNTVVDSYITHQSAQKRDTSSEVLKILQKEKVKRDIEFTEKLKVMMDFKKENMALAFENRNSNIILDRLAQLSNAMTRAQLQTIEDKSLYEVTKSMVDDPVMIKQLAEAERADQVYVAADEKNQLNVELNQLQQQMTNLTGQVPNDHPAAKVLRVRAEQIKGKINEIDIKFAKAQLAIVEKKYIASKEGEEQVRRYFEDQRQQALDLNEQVAQYTVLQFDWEQTKKLCDILDERIKELAVTEEVGALNITILEVARPADKPSKPQKARTMAMALVLGLMLGGGLALLRDWMDHRLRSAEEISAILGVPVLGTVLVSNLAIAMAQAGQKTLIIDADFRKPMQHEIFKADDSKGLSALLAGIVSLDDAIQPAGVDGLDLLTCGPDVPNPSEMLNSEAFSKMLKSLSEKYDRIVIDSPPVMPVTDAQILAALCDITLLILRAEQSSRKASQQARDGLLGVGARILGAIVNDVSRRNGRYGYYSGYGNYGYYGRGKSAAASITKQNNTEKAIT